MIVLAIERLRREEENLIAKIKSSSITWEDKFNFGRGVEISKSGKVVFCSKCGCAQGYKKSQFEKGEKTCTYCGEKIIVSDKTIKSVISKQSLGNDNLIYVGENVKRYGIEGGCYIKTAVPGINYKNLKMYTPPKLLIRKTGLGIYASIDYTGSMTSQTVYILKLRLSSTCGTMHLNSIERLFSRHLSSKVWSKLFVPSCTQKRWIVLQCLRKM